MVQQITEEKILQASYPDPPQLITSKTPISRLDTSKGRVYYQRDVKEEDRVYIYSSTTILSNVITKGIGFNMWLGNSLSYDHAMEYAKKRAFLGTMCHAMIMHLIWGEIVDTSTGFYNEDTGEIENVPNEIKLRLQGFIEFYLTMQPEPIATEIALYTNELDEENELMYPWSGTADQILRMPDGKLWLVDIKTGKAYDKDHELQLTSYKLLWDHLFGKEHGEIDKLGCLYLNSRGKYKLKEYKFVPYNWYNIYENFEYMIRDGRGSMPKIEEKPELPTKYSIKGDVKDE
ncbi:MAG: hypothetical protein Unbinned4139contig1000_6 [Prokaryotic dsDNA virus sp.]|nr:MAG: hypothetical protein Unbinned4139contig1000_6 [Prokaryotic dsDNA virus sp.]|tara:strand:- start:6324 stop:7190 length:867 start_codon:yes stop_codon:yes gene_type:complete